MVGYLMDRLGYSKDKALVTSKSLLRITTIDKLNVVLTFLHHRVGLSTPQLHAFICHHPTILTSDIRSNLLPKLKILKSLLPSPSPTKDPTFLATTFVFGYDATHLASAIDFLRSLLPPSTTPAPPSPPSATAPGSSPSTPTRSSPATSTSFATIALIPPSSSKKPLPFSSSTLTFSMPPSLPWRI